MGYCHLTSTAFLPYSNYVNWSFKYAKYNAERSTVRSQWFSLILRHPLTLLIETDFVHRPQVFDLGSRLKEILTADTVHKQSMTERRRQAHSGRGVLCCKLMGTRVQRPCASCATHSVYIQNFISSYWQHMWMMRYKKRKKIMNKVNDKTVQRSVNIIQDLRWQTICSVNYTRTKQLVPSSCNSYLARYLYIESRVSPLLPRA